MKILTSVLILGIALVATSPAYAQSVGFDTEKVRFKADLPDNFCVLEGTNERDAFFLSYLQKASGKSLKIHVASIPCDELRQYRKQKSHLPTQFIALSQVGVDGSYVRFLLGKGVYARLIESFDLKKGITKIKKRTADKLRYYGDDLQDIQAKILGTDKRGNIWMQGALNIKEKSQAVRDLQLVGGTNLVEKYPLAVFYGSTDSTLDMKSAMSAVSEVIGSISSR